MLWSPGRGEGAGAAETEPLPTRKLPWGPRATPEQLHKACCWVGEQQPGRSPHGLKWPSPWAHPPFNCHPLITEQAAVPRKAGHAT